MEENKVLKIVYTFFVGLLLAIFVGVGINTFYEEPAYPEYTSRPYEVKENGPTEEQLARDREFDKKMQEYNDAIKPYNRNVSIITLIAAVAFLSISIAFEKRLKFIADGVMLGGLFTLLYSLIRGFVSQDSKYVFIAVSIGLVIVLYLGYHRFTKSDKKASIAKKVSK